MRLAHIFTLALLVFAPACMFFDDSDRPTRDAVPNPEFRDAGDGQVYFTPPQYDHETFRPPESDGGVTQDAGTTEDTDYADAEDTGDTGVDDGNTEVVCTLGELIHETEPEDVDRNAITFVEDVVDIDEDLDPQPVGYADYVYLREASLHVTSGSDFDFLNWIRVSVDREGADSVEVAWGADFRRNARSIQLKVDGALDLRDYLVEGGTLYGKVRASAPSKTTWIKARLTFITLSECH